jgi:hypothetical protein
MRVELPSGCTQLQQKCEDCGETVHSWEGTVNYEDWKLTEHGWSPETIAKNRLPRVAKCIAECVGILRGDGVGGKIETPEVISALESTLAALSNASRANAGQHSLSNFPPNWDSHLGFGAAAKLFTIRAERIEASTESDKAPAKYFRNMARHYQGVLDDFLKLLAKQNLPTSGGSGKRRR